MAALAAQLAALSNKADELLEVYHQELFTSGLDVSFNRATLATKYWLPLPESLKSTHRTAAHEDEHPQDDSDEQIHSALRECRRALRHFERFAQSEFRKIPPNAAKAFAQSVRKISRLIDARRQSSDSDSDSSLPGSTKLYTQDAGKAGPQVKSHRQISPRGFTGYESFRPSAAPEESAQHLTSNIQTYEHTELDIRKRPSSFAGDEDDMLSSPGGSQTQLYSLQSQNDDAIQSLHSVFSIHNRFRDFDTNDLPDESPSSEPMVPGRPFAPEGRYGHVTREPETSSTIRPASIEALPTVHDHTTYRLGPGGNEYLPSEIDPSGETKVSKDGYPLGGRVFRCRTFQLPGHGNTLFMLATQCARVLGYGDPGLLFKFNSSLFKIIVPKTEKENLAQQGIVPHSYLSQQIAVVTARSMFRLVGAALIENGIRVQDDYWEAKAQEEGFTEEDAADGDGSGSPQAGEVMVAGASSFTFKDSLESLNIRDENTRKQGSTEEDAAGSPGTHHDSHSGFGSEPPAAVPAVSSVPNSSPSFVSVSSSAKGGSTTNNNNNDNNNNNNNNAIGIDGIGQLTYQRAIDIARNTEGDLDPSVTAYLEDAITKITNNLESYPDSYLLSKDEFAVFNYFRLRFMGEIAERAVDRYWLRTHASEQQQ